MADKFKELLDKIKCGDVKPTVFSQSDLDKVKSCLPPIKPADTSEAPPAPSFDESCLPAALEEAQKIIEDSQKDSNKILDVSKVKGRVQEYFDNLSIVREYYYERLRFFTKVSDEIDILTAERLDLAAKQAAAAESDGAQNSNTYYFTTRMNFLAQQIESKTESNLRLYSDIPTSVIAREEFAASVKAAIKPISGKIYPSYAEGTATFTFKFHELVTGIVKDGMNDRTIKIQQSEYLKDLAALTSTQTYISLESADEVMDLAASASKLYNGADGYAGLYKKIRTPIQSFFTLDERGLSTSPDDVDPLLTGNPDLPKTFTDDNTKYFIKNLDRFQKFYENLGTEIPPRAKKERDEVFPSVIKTNLDKVRNLARREAATALRAGSIGTNLSRDTLFDGTVYQAGDSQLSKTFLIYTQSLKEIDDKMLVVQAEIVALDEKIQLYAVDPAKVEAKIQNIDCFKKAQPAPAGCEDAVEKKRGSDPFGIKTLSGTDATLPDFTSLCYWKNFAKELSLLGLMPIPDLINPVFRYWPVNGIIPAFPGPVILTLPQKWKVISVISSPLGTIVPMIAFPVTFPSPIPIPLPSIYVLYVAPDGNKYMLLAPNIPFLFTPGQMLMGYQFDSSQSAQNPTGLSGPYSGLPIKGSFSMPVTISAKSTKATRLAKLAIDLAQGKTPEVKMPNGKSAPADKGELSVADAESKLLSENEFALKMLETSPVEDFDRLVTGIRTNINNQIDALGDFATDSLQKLKDKVRGDQEKEHMEAKQEKSAERKRKRKALSRKLDTLTIEQKINSVIDEMNNIIDKINLGTITYPDDPSKLNPKFSAAVTSILDFVDLGSRKTMGNDRDTDLRKKVKRISKKINPKSLSAKNRFDLDNPDDVIEVKAILKKYSSSVTDYLKGKQTPVDTSEARSKEEADKMAESSREMQDLIVKSLSFTAVSLASPPKISMFDPTKPCCETEPVSLFKGVPPEVLAILSIFASLMAALVDSLSADSLSELLGGIKQFSIDAISGIFEQLVAALPAITIPKSFDASSLVQALLVPFISAISLPEVPNPLRTPLPIQIKIPLDALIKPLLKLALAALIAAIFRLLAEYLSKLGSNGQNQDGGGINSNITTQQVINQIDCGAFGIVTLSAVQSKQVTITLPNGKKIKLPTFPDLPLDIFGFFWFLMNTDIISLIKKLINAALDGILTPIEAIVRPILSLVPSGSWSSLTTLEIANPFTLAIKMIKLKLEESVPKGLKINLVNMDVYPILLAAAIPILENFEKVLKEIIYLGAAVLCATGGAGVTAARLTHPIFNQDDLPPWERLTRKNPLFTIFLDEVLYKSTIMSLGTLIFHTKLPGMYGTSTFPTLFVPPPRI